MFSLGAYRLLANAMLREKHEPLCCRLRESVMSMRQARPLLRSLGLIQHVQVRPRINSRIRPLITNGLHPGPVHNLPVSLRNISVMHIHSTSRAEYQLRLTGHLRGLTKAAFL